MAIQTRPLIDMGGSTEGSQINEQYPREPTQEYSPTGGYLYPEGPPTGWTQLPDGRWLNLQTMDIAEADAFTPAPEYDWRHPLASSAFFGYLYGENGWQDWMEAQFTYDLRAMATLQGHNPLEYAALFMTLRPQIYQYLDNRYIMPHRQYGRIDEYGLTYWERSIEGLRTMYADASMWLASRHPSIWEGYSLLRSEEVDDGGGPGSGAGAMYDLDQIAQGVTTYWRAYLHEEPTDARGLARAFVDAWMANPALDLKAFVIKHMQSTNRWAQMYAMKPDGMDELEFQQPYFQAATQVLRPSEVAPVAIGGMRMGADPYSFSTRLMHEGTVQKTAPFISGLEGMLREMEGLVR